MGEYWPDVYPDDFVGPLPEGAMRQSDYNELCAIVGLSLLCSALALVVIIIIA